MKFTFAHNNINVVDLDKSIDFYRKALGLEVLRTKTAEDGSFKLTFMGDGVTGHQLELTWLRDLGKEAYDLGDNEIHLAFTVDDMEAAHALHEEMVLSPTFSTQLTLPRRAVTAPSPRLQGRRGDWHSSLQFPYTLPMPLSTALPYPD